MASSNKSTTSKTSARGSKTTQPKKTSKQDIPDSEVYNLLDDLALSNILSEQIWRERKQQEADHTKLTERFRAMFEKRLLAIAQFKQGDYVVVNVNCQKRVGVVIGIVPKTLTYRDIRSYYDFTKSERFERSAKEIADRVRGMLGQIDAGLMSVESKGWLLYEVALIRPNGYAEVNHALYSSAEVAPYTGDFVTVVPKVLKLKA